MTAIALRNPRALTLRAGPAARRHLQQNGLHARDIRTLPGAAGGPKALGLSGLDQAVFGWLATTPAVRELVGASIGGWRFACAMQADPAAALARFAANYVAQDYSRQTTRALIYQNWQALLHDTLGPDGLQAILQHPHYRLSLILVRARGLLRHEQRAPLLAGLALAAACNTLGRAQLRHVFERLICHDARSTLAFSPQDGLPTQHVALSAANLLSALLGTTGVPGLFDGVAIPGASTGVYRDGGLLDYHLDYPWQQQAGITLYLHYQPRIVPGWFDKLLPWRQPVASHHSNTLLVTPSPAYLATLALGRLPDRGDPKRFAHDDAQRRQLWAQAVAESHRLGDEWRERLLRQDWGDVTPL
ncbi:hypothetical protein [Vogesella sp. XCS3]|uniref:hypothetical protein n=1 Tax=Vogesella sp. XCS3 TaxID=2877939 RepID=UPI001D0AE013|nr:hypothetical protein [Vogesella sp. XCS3]UDM18259.1 hypothetical protein LCH97_06245 [Vogesella sp. XCS3]